MQLLCFLLLVSTRESLIAVRYLVDKRDNQDVAAGQNQTVEKSFQA